MSTIRTKILSVVLVLIVTGAVYFAAAPSTVMAAQNASSCPAPSNTVSSLSTQALWKILNGRFERRVGLPY